ncbi:unnamed protein product [Oppiella nova]|uniref:Uncharacterized protein n=1 Tax=Oppiella nova TaxID=334625 RepID=A0A7R9QSI9_9ACAR|nr:unnamed protein product [Oppiella nova]CAG2172326.1 unnamed protein product [Oppiella nova]
MGTLGNTPYDGIQWRCAREGSGRPYELSGVAQHVVVSLSVLSKRLSTHTTDSFIADTLPDTHCHHNQSRQLLSDALFAAREHWYASALSVCPTPVRSHNMDAQIVYRQLIAN